MIKTNAARILDRQGIAYELVSYDVDDKDLSAATVSLKIGQDIQQVYKTLVLQGDKTGVIIAVIPGGQELDLKMAAKVSGNKSVMMVAMKDLFELTGYIRGGCSPLGMKKNYPVYIHDQCLDFPFIFISAGMRGLQLKLAPMDLIRSVNARCCSLF